MKFDLLIPMILFLIVQSFSLYGGWEKKKKKQVIFSPILTVKSGETVPRENLLDFTNSDGQEWWNYTARKTCKNNVSPVSTVGAGENYHYWWF